MTSLRKINYIITLVLFRHSWIARLLTMSFFCLLHFVCRWHFSFISITFLLLFTLSQLVFMADRVSRNSGNRANILGDFYNAFAVWSVSLLTFISVSCCIFTKKAFKTVSSNLPSYTATSNNVLIFTLELSDGFFFLGIEWKS